MKKYLSVIPLVFLLCFVVGCQDKAAMAELEEFRAQAAVETQNKELARSFFAAIDKNDFDGLKALLTDDFSLMSPGLAEPVGFEFIPPAVEAHYSAFPDWVHTIEELVAEGDKVAVKIMQTGTHKSIYQGIPPTDKKVIMPAQVLLVISNGKIKEFCAIEDYLNFFQQLGMELKPKEAGK